MEKIVSLKLLLLFIFCLGAISISAQEGSQIGVPAGGDSESKPEFNYRLRRGAIEHIYEPGIAPFKPSHFAGPEEFDTRFRRLAVANFRIGRVIGTKGRVTYSYLFGFMPLVMAIRNEVKNENYISAKLTPDISPTRRENSYGFGVTPVNFRFLFKPNKRIKPFLQAGAGIMITNKAIPIPDSRNFNFTGDFGGGVMIHQTENRAWTLGYRYFHISNGNLTEKVYNVGYNANTFYLGYSFFK